MTSTFHVVSLGCAKNTVDSEAMEQLLLASGHARAAGLKLDAPFQQAHDRVVRAMATAMDLRK